MSIQPKTLLILGLPLFIIANSAQADAGFAVYGIVASWLGAATFSSLYGHSPTQVIQSKIDQQQISLWAGADGEGNMDVQRLAYRITPQLALWQGKHGILTASLEASIGNWQTDRQYTYRSLTDIGITPVFTLKTQPTSPWYAEVGVGAHWLSNTYIKDYSKSTQFQFGDQAGIGWENQQWRIGYKYLHISNANIETPNPSTDLHFIELGYRF